MKNWSLEILIATLISLPLPVLGETTTVEMYQGYADSIASYFGLGKCTLRLVIAENRIKTVLISSSTTEFQPLEIKEAKNHVQLTSSAEKFGEKLLVRVEANSQNFNGLGVPFEFEYSRAEAPTTSEYCKDLKLRHSQTQK